MSKMATANTKNIKHLVIEWIDGILKRKDWTGTDLARKAEMSPSTILRLLNDPNHEFVPTMKTLTKISTAANTPIPKKLTDFIGVRADAADDDTPRKYRSTRGASHAMVEMRQYSSLPVALRGGTSRSTTADVPAPQQLEGDDTLFAFLMFNDDLDPIIKSGTLMFATRRRDPVKGDTILVTDKSDARAKVRFLLDINENGLTMSKTLPAKEDEQMPFDSIGEIAIIAGSIRI